MPGFTIERVRFSNLVPLKAGFEKIAEIIKAAGRPLTAFGACELRSPAPFTEEGFKAFNEIYIKTLIEWGVMKDGVNPVARSNVCPKIDPPAEPGFHAFSFTTCRRRTRRRRSSSPAAASRSKARPTIATTSFVSATPARQAMLEKAKWVLDEMERRMSAFGGDWRQTTAVQLYTVHDVLSDSGERARQARRVAPRPDLALQSAAGGRSRI